MSAPGETETHPLAYAVERIGAPSEDWLVRRLRRRVLSGRRVGRDWRMTDSDIAEAIALLASPAVTVAAEADATPPPPPGASGAAASSNGLTPTTRRRLAQRSV